LQEEKGLVSKWDVDIQIVHRPLSTYRESKNRLRGQTIWKAAFPHPDERRGGGGRHKCYNGREEGINKDIVWGAIAPSTKAKLENGKRQKNARRQRSAPIAQRGVRPNSERNPPRPCCKDQKKKKKRGTPGTGRADPPHGVKHKGKKGKRAGKADRSGPSPQGKVPSPHTKLKTQVTTGPDGGLFQTTVTTGSVAPKAALGTWHCLFNGSTLTGSVSPVGGRPRLVQMAKGSVLWGGRGPSRGHVKAKGGRIRCGKKKIKVTASGRHRLRWEKAGERMDVNRPGDV